MKKKDLNEAIALTNSMIAMLVATLGSTTQAPAGPKLKMLCGQLVVSAPADIMAGALGADLAACFDQARIAGATFMQMEAIRVWALAQKPEGIPAIAIANAGARLALIEESYVLASTTFASRQDIDNYLTLMNASFDAAEIVAANSLDTAAYEAIIALHASVSSDLVNRSRPLPRMVTYQFQRRPSALWLSQRLYGDADSTDTLIAENKPVHPLFMPASGVCLSA